jgi:hypothetical protein
MSQVPSEVCVDDQVSTENFLIDEKGDKKTLSQLEQNAVNSVLAKAEQNHETSKEKIDSESYEDDVLEPSIEEHQTVEKESSLKEKIDSESDEDDVLEPSIEEHLTVEKESTSKENIDSESDEDDVLKPSIEEHRNVETESTSKEKINSENDEEHQNVETETTNSDANVDTTTKDDKNESMIIDPKSITDSNVDSPTKIDNNESMKIDPTSMTEPNEASNEVRFVDADGWEDLLGSGRLRKRVIVEGDPTHHPSKGSQVKVHFTGKNIDACRGGTS